MTEHQQCQIRSGRCYYPTELRWLLFQELWSESSMGLKETFIYNETAQEISPIPFLTNNFIYKGDKIMANLESTKKKKVCQVENCDAPMRKCGYCARHYEQIRRNGKVIETYFDKLSTTCKVKDCYTKIYSNELCKKHHNQMEQYGKIIQTVEDSCKVEGCCVNIKSNGYCARHAMQMHRYGKIIETYLDKPPRICSVDGCGLPHSSNGYCSKHSMQALSNGKILERTQYDLNEFRFDGNDCYITLYDKDCNPKAEAIIDLEDYEKVKDYKWGLTSYGYVTRSQVYEGNTELYLSRFILFPLKSPLLTIDHKNRNPLDNRKCNLRYATRSQNGINIGPRKNSTSKYKGVGWNKSHKKWSSSIMKKGNRTYIAFFDSEEHAAMAYNCMAIKLFGEFAYLNDINLG